MDRVADIRDEQGNGSRPDAVAVFTVEVQAGVAPVSPTAMTMSRRFAGPSADTVERRFPERYQDIDANLQRQQHETSRNPGSPTPC